MYTVVGEWDDARSPPCLRRAKNFCGLAVRLLPPTLGEDFCSSWKNRCCCAAVRRRS